jgi:hypothetical protein
LERGTNSDKRRQKLGKTPTKTPAELLNIEDLEIGGGSPTTQMLL